MSKIHDVLNTLLLSQITNMHNQFAELTVNRFKDKADAVKRTTTLLESKGFSVEQVEKIIQSEIDQKAEHTKLVQKNLDEAAMKPLKTSQDKEPKAQKAPKEKKRTAFAGKFIKVLSTESKYRAGSIRANMLGTLKDGMSFEAYMEGGGRKSVLRSFVKNGLVEVK